jgi:hypothetical protein
MVDASRSMGSMAYEMMQTEEGTAEYEQLNEENLPGTSTNY